MYTLNVADAKSRRLLEDHEKQEVKDFFKNNPDVDFESAVDFFARKFNSSKTSIKMVVIDMLLN